MKCKRLSTNALQWIFGTVVSLASQVLIPPAMAIRISATKQARRTIVKVDGRLCSEDVAELARILQSVQEAAELDLSDLKSAHKISSAKEEILELIY